MILARGRPQPAQRARHRRRGRRASRAQFRRRARRRHGARPAAADDRAGRACRATFSHAGRRRLLRARSTSRCRFGPAALRDRRPERLRQVDAAEHRRRAAPPSSGTVRVAGEALTGLNRRATYMFQQDALLPWKDVRENVALGLTLAGVGAAPRRRRGRTRGWSASASAAFARHFRRSSPAACASASRWRRTGSSIATSC